MASVDGAKTEDNEQDAPLHVHVCKPCGVAGKTSDATKLCRACQEYMCSPCSESHNESTTEFFTQSMCANPISLENRARAILPITCCDNHAGKRVEWYCDSHDDMFCDICKTVSHRKCKATRVTEASTTTHVNKILEIKGSLRGLKTRLGKLKESTAQNNAEIQCMVKTCETDVKLLKQRIVDWVDNLEEDLLSEIHKIETKWTDIWSEHLKDANHLWTQVDSDLKVAEEAEHIADKLGCLVASNKLSKTQLDMVNTVSDIEKEAKMVDIQFNPDPIIDDLLNDVRKLGNLKVEFKIITPLTTYPGCVMKPVGDMTVVSSKHEHSQIHSIYGLLLLPDDRLVFVGDENTVCLVNINMNETARLSLSSMVNSVAIFNVTEVIVTLPEKKMLMYITVGETLEAGRTIVAGHQYYGVAVHDGDIYVTMQVSVVRGTVVHVLDNYGVVKREIGHNYNYSFQHIAVSRRGFVYISGRYPGVACYNTDGDRVYHVKGNMWPENILVDGDDNVLVSCAHSDTIKVLSPDGKLKRVLLSQYFPRSLSYRDSDDTLFLSGRSWSGVHAYKLK